MEIIFHVWRSDVMPKSLPKPLRKQREVLYLPVTGHSAVRGTAGSGKTTLAVVDSKLTAWLAEASLHARANGSAPLKDLTDSPSLFPFRLAHISAEYVASLSPRLNILRHGLDDDLVMLLEEGGVR
jgi:hypothetical protein